MRHNQSLRAWLIETIVMFDPGFDIKPRTSPMGFIYGTDCFGPKEENRRLDAIRASLKDPRCYGPEIVYSIAMDVGKTIHQPLLHRMSLLFGAVIFSAGRLGNEPVRSQGHVHVASPRCGWSTPEVYEIWEGKAVIYMQQRAEKYPGRCYAIEAVAGDVVVVPPGWPHATISADPHQPLIFGAWCDRQYGFDYAALRRLGGIAWFPMLDGQTNLEWQANPNYAVSDLVRKRPEKYSPLGLHAGMPIYTQFEQNPEAFRFVPEPATYASYWETFFP